MDDKRRSGGLAGISRLKKCYAKDPLGVSLISWVHSQRASWSSSEHMNAR